MRLVRFLGGLLGIVGRSHKIFIETAPQKTGRDETRGDQEQKIMTSLRAISRYLLASLMVFAGVMHFVRADFFLKVMPPYLPCHLELVYLSGVCEAVLGLLMLVPRYRRLASWGIIALLIAVFPVNLHVFQHQELIPAPPIVHWLRLPLQGILILMAYGQLPQTKTTSNTSGS